MYASICLWCLAQGLLLENWLAGWYAFVAFALMYFVRTPREEQNDVRVLRKGVS
jgi:protein-S-isoprenylcysteine O-methyltransferase Ste14